MSLCRSSYAGTSSQPRSQLKCLEFWAGDLTQCGSGISPRGPQRRKPGMPPEGAARAQTERRGVRAAGIRPRHHQLNSSLRDWRSRPGLR